MARHEHFEALCATASIGQATGAELAELQEHLSQCPDCQQVYSEFLQLGAVRCAASAQEQEVTKEEALSYIDSALFREKFLKQAEAQGIVFSRANTASEIPTPQFKRDDYKTRKIQIALPVAASVLLACGTIGGYYFGMRKAGKPLAVAASKSIPIVAAAQKQIGDPDREAAIARLQAERRRLTSEIASLKASLADTSSSLDQLRTNAAASEKERASLLATAADRDAQISALQRQLNQVQEQATNLRTELDQAKTSSQAMLIEDQTKIRELTDQLGEQSAALEREREMLTASRDIRDLMAARNLHIADVFDTDTKGKTRAAFGRVFFTEGKSLIIYAYDLNDHRVQDAGYYYRVWGKKEGPGQAAKSLGIFYSDDKAQKRWVFKYDDPKVLSEIDSVFVTLEPPGKNPTEPKGDKFLYAYLRNQPNHP
jgi:DNA repair exonuclease SbcCD ATPase subunit